MNASPSSVLSVDPPTNGRADAGSSSTSAIQESETAASTAVAASKIPGVRAAVVENEWSARDAVEHVDVNLLTLGERVLGESLAKSIVDAYLGARAQGGRHARRREQIAELDKGEPVVADRSRGMRRGT